jgi:hypothetical protein
MAEGSTLTHLVNILGELKAFSLKGLIDNWNDQVLKITAEIALQPEFSEALQRIHHFYLSEYTATGDLNQAMIELEKAIKKGLLQNEINSDNKRRRR